MKEIDLDAKRSIDWEQIGRQYDPHMDWEDMLLIRQTASLIARYAGDARRVIEVGTATGAMTHLLLETFPHLHIMDPARVNLDRVVQNVPRASERITAHCSRVEDFNPTEPFDLVIFSFVLEHVEDPVAALRALARLARVGGKVVVTVPNYESLNRRLGVELGMVSRIDYFQEKDRLVGHRRLYSVDKLRADVGQAGQLRELAMHGLLLKPLSKAQMEIFRPDVLQAFCKVGLDFPSLSVGLFQLLERTT